MAVKHGREAQDGNYLLSGCPINWESPFRSRSRVLVVALIGRFQMPVGKPVGLQGPAQGVSELS